ncbi:MAG TPA: response regulator [Vicinamibacterales bacterium]
MPKTILIVDDHEDTRQLLQFVLQQAGYDVVSAVDGREAVAKVRSERPDAVVMDIFMPVMDGFEATKLIKGDPVIGHIPVIAHSAKPESCTNDMSLFEAICAKPCSPDQMVETLDGLLGAN